METFYLCEREDLTAFGLNEECACERECERRVTYVFIIIFVFDNFPKQSQANSNGFSLHLIDRENCLCHVLLVCEHCHLP